MPLIYQTPKGQYAASEKEWREKMKAEGSDPKQASRKSINVPTAKADLMQFLEFHNVNLLYPVPPRLVVPEGLDAPLPDSPGDVIEVRPTTVTEAPGDLDALFEAAPIRQQLRLAVSAIDAADVALLSKLAG